jgi:hypothetical protein
VWECGDEIRLRIMSGIGSAFELAMNNPAGMVALVEAVEVYETANQEYKTVHGEEAGSSQTLRFTDMRASALVQIYQDFELRGLEVFREVHEAVSIDIDIYYLLLCVRCCFDRDCFLLSHISHLFHTCLLGRTTRRRRRRRNRWGPLFRRFARLQWLDIRNFLCPKSNGRLLPPLLGVGNLVEYLCRPRVFQTNSRTNWW